MLTICTWKWGTRYGPQHVNNLRAMVARHLRIEHEFVCVTDDARGLRSSIRVVPLPQSAGWTEDDQFCVKRLWMFSEEAGKLIGTRFVNMDLDTVIVNDITPLLDRDEDFVIWRAPFYDPVHHACNDPPFCYNPSLVMMNAGSRKFVWEKYKADPQAALDEAAASGWIYQGDQDVISNLLMPREATWGLSDGLYAYWTHMNCGTKPLPDDARIVSFYGGSFDPSQRELQYRSIWIVEHWNEL